MQLNKVHNADKKSEMSVPKEIDDSIGKNMISCDNSLGYRTGVSMRSSLNLCFHEKSKYPLPRDNSEFSSSLLMGEHPENRENETRDSSLIIFNETEPVTCLILPEWTFPDENELKNSMPENLVSLIRPNTIFLGHLEALHYLNFMDR